MLNSGSANVAEKIKVMGWQFVYHRSRFFFFAGFYRPSPFPLLSLFLSLSPSAHLAELTNRKGYEFFSQLKRRKKISIDPDSFLFDNVLNKFSFIASWHLIFFGRWSTSLASKPIGKWLVWIFNDNCWFCTAFKSFEKHQAADKWYFRERWKRWNYKMLIAFNKVIKKVGSEWKNIKGSSARGSEKRKKWQKQKQKNI